MKRTIMHRSLLLSLASAALIAIAPPARAITFFDTGIPNGNAVGAYTLDATDFYAGQLSFAQASTIQSVATHILGGTANETFTFILYSDTTSHSPGTPLYSTTASFTSDGWNGVAGLSGWNVSAGSYWVAVELGAADTLGSGSATGALLDRGVPSPLTRTAFNDGSGYQATATPLSFGLRVDAVVGAVPEPSTFILLLLGMSGMAMATRRRQG